MVIRWMGLVSVVILGGLLLFTPELVIGEGDSEKKRSINILVPLKLGFQEFVRWASDKTPPNNASLTFSGFSVEVFKRCVEKLDYALNYTFIGYGDGINDPLYDDLLRALVDSKDIEGVVADLTITMDRWKSVDFTQPYVQSSLQMVVPLHSARSSQDFWIFLRPFSTTLWGAIVALFIGTVVSLFFLEYKKSEDPSQTGIMKKKLSEIIWNTTLSLFFSQGPDVLSHLGRLLMVFWLVSVLIFTSNYTASLSSILAAQQPHPTIQNFVNLQKSRLKVGYQVGSFTYDYMINNLYIASHRLVQLDAEEDYDSALKSGKVAAIIDESPYMETFLTTFGCDYTNVDPNIAYFSGFGFAFKKNSSFTNDFSLAIITLEQNRDLQNIKDKWLGSGNCVTDINTSANISLSSFGGLFIIITTLYFGCIILKMITLAKARNLAANVALSTSRTYSNKIAPIEMNAF